MTRYYVIHSAEGFEVRREGRLKGVHALQVRALQAAKFMASVEAAKLNERALVYLEAKPDRFELAANFTPDDPIALPFGVLPVGDSRVLVR
ncbi:hypothetical protein [Pseudomarimonas arenosa]|uniref:Uncharacterized protein n=1 Tax=Pseudomarimonas arenosa TaxID=2774145 RepID=A0AAW3ZIC4_9GAMM|nr:hypothetical protein [Pseudomarimonas arenosa]MBD8524437.1 hypothetical protein [Pseudomarimonas arenosa]